MIYGTHSPALIFNQSWNSVFVRELHGFNWFCAILWTFAGFRLDIYLHKHVEHEERFDMTIGAPQNFGLANTLLRKYLFCPRCFDNSPLCSFSYFGCLRFVLNVLRSFHLRLKGKFESVSGGAPSKPSKIRRLEKLNARGWAYGNFLHLAQCKWVALGRIES